LYEQPQAACTHLSFGLHRPGVHRSAAQAKQAIDKNR